MAFELTERGIHARCVHVFGQMRIQAQSATNARLGQPVALDWQYHVAVLVSVISPDGPADVVLDPATMAGPLVLADWLALIGVNPTNQVHVSQPPTAPRWPDFDALQDRFDWVGGPHDGSASLVWIVESLVWQPPWNGEQVGYTRPGGTSPREVAYAYADFLSDLRDVVFEEQQARELYRLIRALVDVYGVTDETVQVLEDVSSHPVLDGPGYSRRVVMARCGGCWAGRRMSGCSVAMTRHTRGQPKTVSGRLPRCCRRSAGRW